MSAVRQEEKKTFSYIWHRNFRLVTNLLFKVYSFLSLASLVWVLKFLLAVSKCRTLPLKLFSHQCRNSSNLHPPESSLTRHVFISYFCIIFDDAALVDLRELLTFPSTEVNREILPCLLASAHFFANLAVKICASSAQSGSFSTLPFPWSTI